jgi:hypothetical protein
LEWNNGKYQLLVSFKYSIELKNTGGYDR